jgi:hypothetical protein
MLFLARHARINDSRTQAQFIVKRWRQLPTFAIGDTLAILQKGMTIHASYDEWRARYVGCVARVPMRKTQ